MWEAIRSNQRRSWLLIGLMGVILLALGAVIGIALVPPIGDHYLDPHNRGPGIDPLITGLWGAGVAFVIWLIMWVVAVVGGDAVLLSATGARRIQKEHAPQLWNTVEEMTIASGLGKMPKVYVIDDPAPNAFAVGYKSERAAVAVTSGLLRRLNRDELQGVVAHEIGHIRNLDVRFMTMAGIMVGSIALISDLFLYSLWFGAGRRRSSSSRGGGHVQMIMMLVAIAAAILAPICTNCCISHVPGGGNTSLTPRPPASRATHPGSPRPWRRLPVSPAVAGARKRRSIASSRRCISSIRSRPERLPG